MYRPVPRSDVGRNTLLTKVRHSYIFMTDLMTANSQSAYTATVFVSRMGLKPKAMNQTMQAQKMLKNH